MDWKFFTFVHNANFLKNDQVTIKNATHYNDDCRRRKKYFFCRIYDMFFISNEYIREKNGIYEKKTKGKCCLIQWQIAWMLIINFLINISCFVKFRWVQNKLKRKRNTYRMKNNVWSFRDAGTITKKKNQQQCYEISSLLKDFWKPENN